ncbi:MAG TPA: hypothetical protein VGN38_01485 [Caulobacteraceae bacterium]|jgi:hypothetical protein|nr:hypothetical protein [Caulobacteraceae bacterium]
MGNAQLIGLAIPILIAIAILAVRNSRPRRLRLQAMWVRPVIFLVLIAFTFASATPPGNALTGAVLIAAPIAGVGLGWLRGSLMRIEVHPETHDISARASTAGMLFIIVLLALRTSLRTAASGTPISGLPASVLADALILFAGAMMITQSAEMWLRASRLLGEAKQAKLAAGPPANPPIVT